MTPRTRALPWAAMIPFLLAAAACGAEAPAGAPAQEPAQPAAEAPAAAPAAEPDAAEEEAVHEILGQGIDVSSHVGTVDWQEIRAAGHTFAFIKATEGMDLADPSFPAWWPEMKEAGIVRGAYHFYVTEDDPTAQAEFFIATAPLEPGDLAPVVDVETLGHDTQPGLPDRLRTFLSLLEAHYGVKPIVYTSPNFWNQNLGAGFGDHPLWVAEYDVTAPTIPDGWDEWHLWQWQEDTAVPGVENGADLSQVNPAGVDLSVLVIPAPE